MADTVSHQYTDQPIHWLQWTTVGDVDVDIGANPSAEEADEGTESTSRKVVDVVDSFRLVVCDQGKTK